MRDTEEIRKAFELCKPQKIMRMCGFCPYNDEPNCDVALYNDVLSLLKEPEAERLEFIETVAKLTAENVTLKEQEAKTGRWIVLEYCANEGIYCSECHVKIFDRITKPKDRLSKYCPHCGSRNEQFFRDGKVVFR